MASTHFCAIPFISQNRKQHTCDLAITLVITRHDLRAVFGADHFNVDWKFVFSQLDGGSLHVLEILIPLGAAAIASHHNHITSILLNLNHFHHGLVMFTGFATNMME
jgi:hypothetical protein